MISADALVEDLVAVLEKHLDDDPYLELTLTLHVRPNITFAPYDGVNDVPDVATIRISLDALKAVPS